MVPPFLVNGSNSDNGAPCTGAGHSQAHRTSDQWEVLSEYA